MSQPDASHLDLDDLCDVLAGVADDDRAQHTDRCEQCRTGLEELQAAQSSVTAALRELADPPVPAELVTRLDALLAAERTPKVATATATVTPLHATWSRRTRWLPWAAGVAAACAVVVGALALRPGSAPSQKDATRTDAQQQVRTSSTGNRYSAKSPLLAQALPQLLAGVAGTASAPERAAGSAPQSGLAAPPHAAASVDALAALHDPKTLASCLAGLTDPTDATLPLALDYAAFDGQPALVAVYPASKPGKVDVFVVGAGCTQADSRLLFFTRLPKP